jgi:hypothetical protein
MGDKLHQSRGKQPRISDKVPKYILSGKGGGVSQTARRFAWRQPPFKECVTAHWSRDSAPTMIGAQVYYRSHMFIFVFGHL